MGLKTLKTLKTEQQKSKKRPKRPKRPKKQALPETMGTFKALTREEMPWLRLKYLKTLKTLKTEQQKSKKRPKRRKRPKKQALPETMETFKALTREEMPWLRLKHQTEEILTVHTLAENWSNWDHTIP